MCVAVRSPGVSTAPAKGTQRRDGVQVLSRAAAMLRRLSAEPDGLTLIELASRVGLPRSTAHRIVGALVQEGFVATTPSGKLRVGPSLIGIAIASRRDLRHEAGPYLEQLSLHLHETVNLAVLDGDEVLFIDQYTSRRYLRIASEIGARFPVHCTANGKALLATLSAEEAALHLPPRLEALTEHTVIDRRRLLAELEEVRATGIAFDREEHTVGVSAVAAVVSDEGGAIAAITVVMPSARFLGKEEEACVALLHTRDEIQVLLHGI